MFCPLPQALSLALAVSEAYASHSGIVNHSHVLFHLWLGGGQADLPLWLGSSQLLLVPLCHSWRQVPGICERGELEGPCSNDLFSFWEA